MKKISILLMSCLMYAAHAQDILSVRDQAVVIDQILEDRFNNLLPDLMDQSDIDMWVVISREYNEDPVIRTMLPATWLNARRRTILVFYRDQENNTIEKLAVARYDVGKSIKSAWDKEKNPDQWGRLIEIIEERNPKKIGLNFSTDHNIADGIVKTDFEEFTKKLPKSFQSKVVSAENLAVSWIETRTEREMIIYNQLVAITHNVIAEAFSEQHITPGVTTTTDVEWFLRQRVSDLGLSTWFHPTVDIQRSQEALVSHLYSFSGRPEKEVIMPGDLLHCDFGITYLRLNTDCQELAYVLKPEETQAPKFLKDAFKTGNQLQDFLTDNMVLGRLGNDILKKALKQAIEAGLRPSIYTHPLGLYGHSAGTTIGMWDAQGGIDKADGNAYPLHPNTVYAIELNNTVYIPEWKRDIRIMFEEAGFVSENGFRYVNGRQKELLLIPRVQKHQGN